MKTGRILDRAIALLAMLLALPATAVSSGAHQVPAGDDEYVLGFTMNLIDGEPRDLSGYRGKVIVMVNVASKCGLTPQYKALQELYESRAEQGLIILGFPANNFGNQEPGSNDQIAGFCSETYGVTFPMFEKISVKGEDAHPLYRKLAAMPAPIGGEPSWNFTKFIVDREGRVVQRFDPRTRPDDPAFTARIDDLLGENP